MTRVFCFLIWRHSNLRETEDHSPVIEAIQAFLKVSIFDAWPFGGTRAPGFRADPVHETPVTLLLLGTPLNPLPSNSDLNFTEHENRFVVKSPRHPPPPGPEAHRRQSSRRWPVTRIPGSHPGAQTCAREPGGREREDKAEAGYRGRPGQGLSPQQASPWLQQVRAASGIVHSDGVQDATRGTHGSRQAAASGHYSCAVRGSSRAAPVTPV